MNHGKLLTVMQIKQ